MGKLFMTAVLKVWSIPEIDCDGVVLGATVQSFYKLHFSLFCDVHNMIASYGTTCSACIIYNYYSLQCC